MIEVTPRDLRAIQLEVLDRFAQLCTEHRIRWYLAAGTLLGAVRHHGFIPWDDDIDVMVPRDDYDRLRRLLQTNPLPGLRHSSLESGDYLFPFSKLHDTRTAVHEALDPMPDIGIGVDIFPIDTWPRKRLGRALQRRAGRLLGRYLVLATLAGEPASVGGSLARAVLRAVRVLLPVRTVAATLDRMARSGSRGGPLSGVRCWGYYETVPSTAYGEPHMIEFEGRRLPAPADYDQVLTALYGDYLTPPPPGAQRAPHAQAAYWRDSAP